MPLDAVCLTAVVEELRQTILGLRIEKIQQPARDQIVLTLRGNKKLLLAAGASQCRIHLTQISRENPANAPMFCMLLRKHLGGGRISAIEQPQLERVVSLTIDMVDELGEPGQRKLVLECMSKRANLILLDGDERIIECMRRIDMEMDPQRQILPGLFYHYPPAMEKVNPLSVDSAAFQQLMEQAPQETECAAFLLDTFFGLSPLVCREIVSRSCGSCDVILDSTAARNVMVTSFFDWQKSVRENSFTPYMLTKGEKPSDFSYLPIQQYGESMALQRWDTFSGLLDAFYEKREQQERIRQKGQDLQRTASAARDRMKRKLALQEKEYAQTQDRDKLRISGELITANLYRMEKGQRLLRAQNYYEPDCPEVEIPLDPLLTPQQNAAKYFKLYTKAKTAEVYLSQQMAIARRERDWLESVLDELSRAETEQDFADIRRELREAGYLKNLGSGKKEAKRSANRPRQFLSTSGLRILVGRNNTQNDQLTKDAFKSDYWFHTQRIHGSHVILCTQGQEPDPQAMTEAATLAAWFSQGRESGQVAVDYTQIRNVKKPSGARPGMVVYDPYQTAYVTPDEALIKKLTIK